jgi:chromate transporter
LSSILGVVLTFASLSLLAFGGGAAVLPEMQQQCVAVHHWCTDRQFLDMYALTRATPGPTMLVVALIGFKAIGWPGALAGPLGMFAPSSGLMCLAQIAWKRYENASWRPSLERAVPPIAAGTMMAAATMLARTAVHSKSTLVLVLLATFVPTFTRVGIFTTMVLCGLAGLVGWAT